ncbi:MAG: MTH938/NDUFAF3 family protein [Desulfobacterales bacterium]|nr:MTH938/NDUFAF3 family protein [Desulfobacterales bacterium]
MMIESYSFGRMRVAGREYNSDLIVFPSGRIRAPWWRRSGHQLLLDDIEDIVAEAVAILVVGTGASGLLRPVAGLAEQLAQKGIEMLAQPTARAVDSFNRLWEQQKRVGGCFHLTC